MEKLKKINLLDDAGHVSELLVRYRKKNQPFLLMKGKSAIKEYHPKNEKDWKTVIDDIESRL